MKPRIKTALIVLWFVFWLFAYFAAFAMAETRWTLWLQMNRSGNYYKVQTFKTEDDCQTALDTSKTRSDRATPGRYTYVCHPAGIIPKQPAKMR